VTVHCSWSEGRPVVIEPAFERCRFISTDCEVERVVGRDTEPRVYGSRLPNRPNEPFLRSAAVQITEHLQNTSQPFSPFGNLEAFRYTDSTAEMANSVKLPTNSVGLLSFQRSGCPSLRDLPKLTATAAKVGTRPPRSHPVSITVSSTDIKLAEASSESSSSVHLDDLSHVRVDARGRFFFLIPGESTPPLCVKSTPWVILALALLLVEGERKGCLDQLLSELDHAVRQR
jgi:hypothetical protein